MVVGSLETSNVKAVEKVEGRIEKLTVSIIIGQTLYRYFQQLSIVLYIKYRPKNISCTVQQDIIPRQEYQVTAGQQRHCAVYFFFKDNFIL